MKTLLTTVFTMMSCAAAAQDIFILGEVHDNPAHHAIQAERVGEIAPKALVFEMLTPEVADGSVRTGIEDMQALGEALQWDETGFPDFAMYYPIFTAVPDAKVYGAAVPRKEAMHVIGVGLAESFGEEAAAYGLDQPLPEDQQTQRNALQMAAHCDALPEDMLPGMVDVQRMRDASLARAALRALEDTGGPVAVITGNGHARKDWGMPAAIARVNPDVEMFVLGQTEDDNPMEGGFDEVVSSPAVDRPDPCLAFKN